MFQKVIKSSKKDKRSYFLVKHYPHGPAREIFAAEIIADDFSNDLIYDMRQCLIKTYGNQTTEDILTITLSRLCMLAGEQIYTYNNTLMYLCTAENPLEAVVKYITIRSNVGWEETRDD